MRPWIAALFVLCSLSCRDIQPFENVATIHGYQLDGEVTTPNGIPVQGVDVRLYFSLQYVNDTPDDTTIVYVTDPTKPVDVAVYSVDLSFVRQLFLGYRSVGPLPRWTWDGLDGSGHAVPSGKYFIRYVVDTVIRKYSPVLVDGHITATTGISGKFTIGPRNLPVESRFDLHDPDGQFAGVYEILPTIDLTLRKGNARAVYANIKLQKNHVTNSVLVLE